MVHPSIQPIRCPIIVGRDTVLAHLDAAVDGVTRGTGHVVLLLGEAGIGKSRLAGALRARAESRAYAVFEGRCFEEERSIPLAPLLDLLQTRDPGWRSEDPVHDIGPGASALEMLLPQLRATLTRPSDAPHVEPDQDRYRLFHHLTGFFVGCAVARPVVLIIEDLHWSDETTLNFVLYLARRITRHAILLVLTCRADEGQPPAERLLAALQRERLAVTHELPRLEPTDLDVMLRAIFALDRPLHTEFLDALHELSDGNPYIVEELLKSLVAAGDSFQTGDAWDRKPLETLRIPHTVDESVRQRMARLSSAARDMVHMAAVVGRRFDVGLLAELTQHDEQALLAQLRAAMDVQLIVEESIERFAFRHALTRQAVYRQVLARERQALHRRVAAALERRFGSTSHPPLGELGHHCRQAGVWEQTLVYARQAGEQALAMQAARAASEQFTYALEAAEALGIVADPELYRLRARASETLGRFEAARVDQETALAGAQRAGNRSVEWQCLLDLGLLWSGRDLERAGRYVTDALRCAKTLDEPAIIARCLNRVGNWCFNTGALLDAQRYHEEALELFETVRDRPGVAETLDLLGLVTAHTVSAERSRRYFERAIALFEQLDDRRGLSSVLAMTAQMGHGIHDDPFLPLARAQRAVELAHALDWWAGEAFALATLGGCALVRGAFTAALDAARRALDLAEAIEHQMWMCLAQTTLALIYRELLAFPSALQHAKEAAARAHDAGSQYWISVTAATCAELYLLTDDAPRAEALLDRAFGPAPPGLSLPERNCLVLRADLALRRSDPRVALSLLAPLLAPATTVMGPALHHDVWQICAEALVALDRGDEAETLLLAELATAKRVQLRPRLWQIHRALGRLYRAHGRANDAHKAFEEARLLLDALAADIRDEPVRMLEGSSLRAHFLRAATATLPRPRPLTARRAAKQAAGGLTEREREVAVLIARGKSNREIAAALVIGRRTVQTHISSIFAKLHCQSRAQVAAWAVAIGLLKPPDS